MVASAKREDDCWNLLKKPRGAIFHHCALQVNPAHYLKTFRGSSTSKTDEEYLRSLLKKAEDLGITVLALTDHNHVGSCDLLAKLAENTGITIFPGFELTSSEGVHVLCLFSPGMKGKVLERYLGDLGIHDTEPNAGISSKSLRDILHFVNANGGISIAAHATQKHGLFTTLTGQARINAWKHDDLHAIQIPGGVSDLPPDILPIVTNKNPDYSRSVCASKDLPVAVVNARDVCKEEDLSDGASTCWIKMTEATIEGLRQAFLDPESRIRLNSDTPATEHSRIVAIKWEGGFLDGVEIHFNENLNVLVGGRGTGKSTVIESIRLVLDCQPLGDEFAKVHEEMAKEVIKSGTKISLVVYSPFPSPRHYLIQRTYPGATIVRDENDKILAISTTDIMKGLEVYGQQEIHELTRSPIKLTRLLDRFVPELANIQQLKNRLRQSMEESRTKLTTVLKSQANATGKLTKLPALQEQLERYKSAGVEQKLKDKNALIKEKQLLKSAIQDVQSVRDEVADLVDKLTVDRELFDPKRLKGLPGSGYLKEASKVLTSLNTILMKLPNSASLEIDKTLAKLKVIETNWKKEREGPVQERFQKLLRELQKSDIKADDYVQLQEEIEALNPTRQNLKKAEQEIIKLKGARAKLLLEWTEAVRTEFSARERAAKRIGKLLSKQLRIEVAYCYDVEPLIQLLRNRIGGRLAETERVIRDIEDLSPMKFADDCRKGADHLAATLGVSKDQADRICTGGEALILEIEELDFSHIATIYLNVASPDSTPEWKPTAKLSRGQKATAALLLLLLESQAPLVVDQPEDDLDNQFIAEGIVPAMRREKQRRQFIFATHNANLPVLGDAELILGLDAEGEASGGVGRIHDQHVGAIDKPEVKNLLKRILEGGREAFEIRRRKYGF